MKKTVTFFAVFLLVFAISNTSWAIKGPITSYFSWREHPIFGNTRYHTGVDIAATMGTAIGAAKEGRVSSSGWMGGYGYAVIIDHADGTQTLYAHCSKLYVIAGETVKANQTIAAVGSTGYSTGPHLHVELRVNGSPVDPLPFLISIGWDLDYSNIIPISDGLFLDSDINEMPWNLEDFEDIARQIREILNIMADQCIEGFTLLKIYGMNLMGILMIIDLTYTLILFTITDTEEDWTRFLVKKVLKYGFIVGIVTNWDYFINTYLDSFTRIAIIAGGRGKYISENISDPSLIIQKGVKLIEPVFSYLSSYTGLRLVINIHNVLLAMIIGLLIFSCFVIIGVQFFLAYLEFYIIALLSFMTIPFGLVKHTKFLSEKGIGAVLNAGIKLMVMTFMVALVVTASENLTTPKYDHIPYFRVLAASMGLTFLVSRSASLICKLLQVTPKL